LQAMIEEEATMHKYVLVMESARDDNKRVTERKSFDRFEIRTIGQKSHSGLSYQDGRSAILKMACQIIEIEAMTNYDIGITKNVGEIQGGTGGMLYRGRPSYADTGTGRRARNQNSEPEVIQSGCDHGDLWWA
jgi:acetylornithine deacetylase/succinyl-diaminopimelate desuccinylase-like protein